ncbi:hypothetical protein OROHE_009882 [Orobanche hederae]
MFASTVWVRIANWCNLHCHDISSCKKLLLSASLGERKVRVTDARIICLATLWEVWRARNSLLFDSRDCNPSEVAEKAIRSVWWWFKNAGRIKADHNFDTWSLHPVEYLTYVLGW